ncbi:transmembrane protein, putative [Medicago truncatula]|uniref:Transmembrane protein, putative n=1 Tax=Medicago truncatula TaxID=3880 RepID=G7JGY7_MEDTR|nr:transmembrane protein, putative [Medicago truncatula]
MVDGQHRQVVWATRIVIQLLYICLHLFPRLLIIIITCAQPLPSPPYDVARTGARVGVHTRSPKIFLLDSFKIQLTFCMLSYILSTRGSLAKDLEITDSVCYCDSLHCINLLKDPFLKFHVYDVLIENSKELIKQRVFTSYRIL